MRREETGWGRRFRLNVMNGRSAWAFCFLLVIINILIDEMI